jgi:putative membrane protein
MNAFSTLALLAHDRDWDGPTWPFVPIVPILVIATIWLIASRRGWGNPRVSGESVLAERYARGEIDEPEYRARRDVLRTRK